ncbi:MAG: UDP-N-acetylglucosamine--N-acetylmuramyl-(pentapeptide) pyrophosphoryl-undecaprenol N-acetylglucosamine transferase [Anaeroplasma sp.]
MIVYTGGKTGGHIIPLLNIIQVQREASEYVGYKNNLEEKLCNENAVKFIGLNNKGNKIINILNNYHNISKIYKKKKIKMIVSTGGYVSIPMLLYGIFHRIPIVLYEENVIIGKTIKFFEPFSKYILLAHPLKKMKKKYRYVGLPVKKENKELHKNNDILVIGGSLGSKPLCDIALKLSEKYKVLLIAGKYKDSINENKNLRVIDFSNDIYSLIKSSKCVISRSGAMTTYEVMYLSVPLIVIPSENTVMNHQVLNAQYFSDIGVCKMFRENDNFDKLIIIVEQLLHDSNCKIDMIYRQKRYVIKDTNERIVKILNEI